MKNLGLIIKNEKVVVSSRIIAKNFSKRHDAVLRDIDNLWEGLHKSEETPTDYFRISSYVHEQNNQNYRCFDVTKKGFQLLAMGFNGQKALEWKVKYIAAFEKMAQEIQKPKKLAPIEQLKLQNEVIIDHDSRLKNLEDNMTIDYGQQRVLSNKAKERVLYITNGKKSPVYKNRSLRTKIFSCIWKDLKDYFLVNSYKDTPKKDFDRAIEFVSNWTPQGKLLREIEDCNRQMYLQETAAGEYENV